MSSVGKNYSTYGAFFTGFGGIVREIRLPLVSTDCLISHATQTVFRQFILDKSIMSSFSTWFFVGFTVFYSDNPRLQCYNLYFNRSVSLT
jgi:hypothetical protein